MGNPVIDAVLTRTSAGNSVCVSASTADADPTYAAEDSADDAGALRREIKRCQHLTEDFFTAVCARVRGDLDRGYVTKDGLSEFRTWTDRIGGPHTGEDQTDLNPIGSGGEGKSIYHLDINPGDQSDRLKDVRDQAMRFFPPNTASGRVIGDLENTYRKLLEDGQELPDQGAFRLLANGVSVSPEYIRSNGEWIPRAYIGVMERAYHRNGSGISVKVTHMTMMMDDYYLREGTDQHRKLVAYIAYRMGGDIDRARQFYRVT
jgi:hypothetical protein